MSHPGRFHGPQEISVVGCTKGDAPVGGRSAESFNPGCAEVCVNGQSTAGERRNFRPALTFRREAELHIDSFAK